MSQPRTVHLLGNILHFHAFSHEREGRFCVVESLTAPGAGAPPNHHAGEQESFVILDGTFEFTIDETTRAAGPGEVVNIPDGAVHSFTNVGKTPGRLMIINSPGTRHEQFFTTAGEPLPNGANEIPAPDGPPDIPAILAAAAAAEITIVPPPDAG
jgi:mannose-6-phosphate isomerase-like protein (cupin superfamily)